jgi:hypothetical protein
MRVQPGPDRGAADREFAQSGSVALMRASECSICEAQLPNSCPRRTVSRPSGACGRFDDAAKPARLHIERAP